MDHNGTRDWFGYFIGAPHGDRLIAGFVVFPRAEAQLIRFKILKSKMLLQSEEINKIVQKQQLMYGKTRGTYV